MAAFPKEITDIFRVLVARHDGQQAALATVIDATGSTYRQPGARLLLLPDGQTVGGISGGCLEADVIERAGHVIANNTAEVVAYNTADEDPVWGLQLGCGGVLTVWIEPLRLDTPPAYLGFFAESYAARQTGAIATVVDGTLADAPAGSRLLFDAAGTLLGTGGAGALADQLAANVRQCLQNGGTLRQNYGLDGSDWIDVFIEPVVPPLALVLCGSGNDAQPLCRLGAELGWRITIIDPRRAYGTAERFPQAMRRIHAHPPELPGLLTIEPGTAAVVMTHRYDFDVDLLRWLAASDAVYIGLLGPHARREALLADLRRDGVELAADPRFHAPVGLNLGGDSPAHVALSIVAEIQAATAHRDGRPLRLRRHAIHDS